MNVYYEEIKKEVNLTENYDNFIINNKNFEKEYSKPSNPCLVILRSCLDSAFDVSISYLI